MNLIELFKQKKEEIINESAEALTRASLKHYKESGREQNQHRLEELYHLTQDSIKSKDLAPMLEYSQGIARERYRDGFDLQEVQTAFNVLEEILWKHITAELVPTDYPEAFGLVSTVLGAGKQVLASEYVSLVSQKRGIESLDMRALFKGL